MAIIERKLKITNVDNDVEKLEPLNIAYANVKWCGLLYNSLEFPPHKKFLCGSTNPLLDTTIATKIENMFKQKVIQESSEQHCSQ